LGSDHLVVKVAGAPTGLQVLLTPIRGRRLVYSVCGERAKRYNSLAERDWRHVQLWVIAVTLVYSPRRAYCPHCRVKVEKVPWSEGKSRLTPRSHRIRCVEMGSDYQPE